MTSVLDAMRGAESSAPIRRLQLLATLPPPGRPDRCFVSLRGQWVLAEPQEILMTLEPNLGRHLQERRDLRDEFLMSPMFALAPAPDLSNWAPVLEELRVEPGIAARLAHLAGKGPLERAEGCRLLAHLLKPGSNLSRGPSSWVNRAVDEVERYLRDWRQWEYGRGARGSSSSWSQWAPEAQPARPYEVPANLQGTPWGAYIPGPAAQRAAALEPAPGAPSAPEVGPSGAFSI